MHHGSRVLSKTRICVQEYASWPALPRIEGSGRLGLLWAFLLDASSGSRFVTQRLGRVCPRRLSIHPLTSVGRMHFISSIAGPVSILLIASREKPADATVAEGGSS